MSLKVNRRWAAHVEMELQRLGIETPRGALAIGGRTGVTLCGPSSQPPILRPGALALTALVQLPDGAGVDAAWGALSSIPDVDATAERAAGQEEASSRETHGDAIEAERARLAGHGRLPDADAYALRCAGWTTLPDGRWRDPADGITYDPSRPHALGRLREHAARIRANAEQARHGPSSADDIAAQLAALKAERRDALDELGAVGDETLAAAAKRVADDLVATRNALDAHDPRWGAALEREARALERYKAESAQRDAAALRAAAKFVRSEQEARLVLAALGYSSPDAVERVLQGDDEEADEHPAVKAMRAAPVVPGQPSDEERGPTCVEQRRALPFERGWDESDDELRERIRATLSGDGARETPASGAMRPETRRRIEDAMQRVDTRLLPYPAGDLLSFATTQLHLASRDDASSEMQDAHILRAIAYLVRRLELDAPAAEEPR